MSAWKIKTNRTYAIEFYHKEEFILGMNSKNTRNPFVIKYIYYNKNHEEFLIIKESTIMLFLMRYKILVNNTNINLNINLLHKGKVILNDVEVDVSIPVFALKNVVTFFSNKSEIGSVKIDSPFKSSFTLNIYEEHDYDLSLAIIGAIFIDGTMQLS